MAVISEVDLRVAMLIEQGSALEVRDVERPRRGSGEALVDIVAAPVLAYAKEVFGGNRPYGLPLPFIPGCGAVGRISELGPDATRLSVGDWVFCDPTIRSRDDVLTPDIVLQGWDARGEGGRRLQRHYRDGPFAQCMMLPTENLVALPPIERSSASRWCALNTLLIPYGGLLAGRFSPGETILVHGATGHFGSATVAVALAMGAAQVIAAGRNNERLVDLVRRFGDRVLPVQLSGDATRDGASLAAVGRIDCVLDFLPPSADASAVRTAIMAVRAGGRVILMGGVGTAGGADLAIPYSWLMLNDIELRGKWMYPREAAPSLLGLIQGGLLDLGHFEAVSFDLADINSAIEHAAMNAGPFKLTTVLP